MTTSTKVSVIVRVTFSDGSVWDMDAARYLDEWASEEGEAVARAVMEHPDMEFLSYCIDCQRDDVLSGRGDLDDFKRRQFIDWLACTFSWSQMRRRATRVEGPHAIYSNHTAEWPRADIVIVAGKG